MLVTAPIKSIRTIIYREGRTWYGVAIELNIVESGDSAEEAAAELDDALQLYIGGAREDHIRLEDIHHEYDAEHEALWKAIHTPSRRNKLKVHVHKAETMSPEHFNLEHSFKN